MRRITKAALGGVAGCAMVLGGTQLASGDTLFQQVFPGWLTDVDTDNIAPLPPGSDGLPMTGAFDSAKAKLKVVKTSDGKTTFSLEVRDIDPEFEGRTFGSHLHVGSCVPGSASAAGPHYTNPNLDPLTLPLKEREIWFTVIPDEHGDAFDQAEVDYVPEDHGWPANPVADGIMSIVIHRDPTNTDPAKGTVGGAGPREVCLPLVTPWG